MLIDKHDDVLTDTIDRFCLYCKYYQHAIHVGT